MRYLVIGDCGSVHIYNFVKNFLIPKEYEIHLLTLSSLPVKESFREFYAQNNITVHSIAEKGYKGVEKTGVYYRILNLWRKLRLCATLPYMDVCHVHSVYKTAMVMLLSNRKKFGKVVLSYWGGDIEDTSKKVVRLRERCFAFADAITVTTKKTLSDFCKIYGNKYDNKLHICRFATAGLDFINKISKTMTKEQCRMSYNIPKDKICITCGYSAYREQHQDLSAREIAKLPQQIKDRIFCIVPMQYGRMNDTEYLDSVKRECEAGGFDYRILRDFVPLEMSAQLAVATDIYLHLRDTDAFSNALKEHVYSGSEIITGTWLEYIELEEMDAPLTSIQSFDELAPVLLKKLEDFQPSSDIRLFCPIYEMYSTEKINSQWEGVHNKIFGGDSL